VDNEIRLDFVNHALKRAPVKDVTAENVPVLEHSHSACSTEPRDSIGFMALGRGQPGYLAADHSRYAGNKGLHGLQAIQKALLASRAFILQHYAEPTGFVQRWLHPLCPGLPEGWPGPGLQLKDLMGHRH
jgi:hypothetical protein